MLFSLRKKLILQMNVKGKWKKILYLIMLSQPNCCCFDYCANLTVKWKLLLVLMCTLFLSHFISIIIIIIIIKRRNTLTSETNFMFTKLSSNVYYWIIISLNPLARSVSNIHEWIETRNFLATPLSMYSDTLSNIYTLNLHAKVTTHLYR